MSEPRHWYSGPPPSPAVDISGAQSLNGPAIVSVLTHLEEAAIQGQIRQTMWACDIALEALGHLSEHALRLLEINPLLVQQAQEKLRLLSSRGERATLDLEMRLDRYNAMLREGLADLQKPHDPSEHS